ncbi:MAG: carbohydrate porin, partial [Verrucomicrobia bacterium]|nr:carbohydrate porin [Verrucomicrobiota bacterium]
LLPLLLLAGFTAPLSAQESGDIPGTPVGYTSPDAMLGYSRFWSYYDPYPSNFIGSSEWFDGNALTGDWWGVRNFLDDSGVELSASYTNNIAGNPVGGMTQSFAYADNFSFGMQLDFEKLIKWQGLTLTVSALDRNGSNLSARNIGNQFTVQQVYGTETVVFYALVLEQRLLEDKLGIKLGRFSTGDDFASSPLYWLYMNNGIDGNPQALPVNTAFTSYPASVWGARLRVDPSPEWFAMGGIYQATSLNLYRDHGLDWSINNSDGVLMIGQVGWTPEFFKKPAAASKPSDGKSLAEGKTVRLVSPDAGMQGLPGHYWFGAYYSPWQFAQFGSTETASNSYGFYWHADQMVWQEEAGSDQGLTLWSAFVLSPQQNISKLPFQVNSGIVYKGLVPARDYDTTMLGFVYGNFSDDYAGTVAATGAGTPSYEIALEAGYRIQVTKFAYIQPNVQWIINPGGTGNIPNALVLGAQMNVTF